MKILHLGNVREVFVAWFFKDFFLLNKAKTLQSAWWGMVALCTI
jgi:hypothetical protein